MKKVVALAILFVGMTNFAQDRKENPRKERMEQFTPAQRSQLMAKKMTLELDLNELQQKELTQIINEVETNKEAISAQSKSNNTVEKEKRTSELFARKIKLLDEQIIFKTKLKKILTEAQFKKWESNMEHRKTQRTRKMIKNKKGGE